MRDKIKISIITVIIGLLYCSSAFGYTGKGTSENPFLVATGGELKTVLEEEAKSSWCYVAITDIVAIKKTITVEKGKFIVYAKGGNQTIRKSRSLTEAINNQSNPGYCLKILNGATVSFGKVGNHILTLDGSMSSLSGKKSSGWVHVSSGGTFTLHEYGKLLNAINNENKSAAPVLSEGTVNVYGEILNCKGYNGGAIKNKGGEVNIYDSARIHNCQSYSEGGAIHNSQKGKVTMNGGSIYSCNATQEGGALFSTDTGSNCAIISGKIYKNVSGNSAGGVFSGYGATLILGNAAKGPSIYENTAGGSGGGVRCNGGSDENAGGISYFYNGSITKNISGKYGGGIACGNAGSKGKTELHMEKIVVSNNQSDASGGGIWIPEKVKGKTGSQAVINSCTFENNTSKKHGGAVMNHGKVYFTKGKIQSNSSQDNGGGIAIAEEAVLRYDGGTISSNKTINGNGNGIYVNGMFKINGGAYINTNNNVYLAKDKYIEITAKLNSTVDEIAVIESEIKTNGTKLVNVNYQNGMGKSELYKTGTPVDEYKNVGVKKRFRAIKVSDNQLLRSTESVTGYTEKWIIISEKYIIKFDKNTTDNVENLPESQIKFWEERIILSQESVKRKGYIADETKHWNFQKDGKGTKVSPGQVYSYNGSRTLYAQWKKPDPTKIFITTADRYYVVGQDADLTAQELLKKIKITDDVDSGMEYQLKVKEIKNKDGSVIASGEDITTEKYINTHNSADYIVKIFTETKKRDVNATAYFNVYVIESSAQVGTVRFISKEYMYTLSENSKWNGTLREKIDNIVKGTEGTIKIKYNSDSLMKIKDGVKKNNYKITGNMNKTIIQEW